MTRRRFLFELVPVVALILVPVSVQANMIAKLAELFDTEVIAYEKEAPFDATALSLSLLSATQNPVLESATGGASITYENGVLIATGPVGRDAMAKAQSNKTGEISVYVVRDGDSLSQIAEMFGVTSNTILWANDLKSAASIKPGDTLVILPVAGVQHTVKSGETIASIVKKYSAELDEVLAYNNLSKEDTLTAGEEIIIPGGTISVPKSSSVSGSGGSGGGSGLAHPMPGAVRSQGIHGYNGIDFARVPVGTTVRASADGKVTVAKASGWNGGYGNYVVIKHASGVQTLYAHLSSVDVVTGQVVSQGDRIGGVGNTGRSTGVHLHFEVRGGKNPF